jgi:hypothetical protein
MTVYGMRGFLGSLVQAGGGSGGVLCVAVHAAPVAATGAEIDSAPGVTDA